MSKKILHFQIPLLEGTTITNAFAVSQEIITSFVAQVKEKIGDEYIVMASPFMPQLIDENNLYNFDAKQVSLDELKNMLKNGE